MPSEAKFCNKCGKPIEAEKPKVDIEEIKRSLKNTGNSASAIGWITIIINIGIYLWSILDKNFAESGLPASNLSGTFLIVVTASIFIILGNRIKGLIDKNIKLYLQILLGLSFLFLILILLTGGSIGILFFLVVAYLISSLVSISKAMKVEEFAATLTNPKYKLDKKGWVIFAVAAVILFFITVAADLSKGNYSTKETAQENVANYFTDTSSWKNFNSPVGRFKAEFPTYPKHKTESVPVPNTQLTLKYDSYTSEEANGTAYLVNVTTFDSQIDTSNPDNNLEGALNGMLSSTQENKLISSNMSYFSGYHALDFLIQNNTMYLKGKIIMAGKTLYQLVAAYENQNYSESNYNKFINSFAIQ